MGNGEVRAYWPTLGCPARANSIAAASPFLLERPFARRSLARLRPSLSFRKVLRLLHGGVLHELIDLDLKAPEDWTSVRVQNDFGALNRGYGPAASCSSTPIEDKRLNSC